MLTSKLKKHGLISLLLLAVISISVLAQETDEQTTESTPESVPSQEAPQATLQKGEIDPGAQQGAEASPQVKATSAKPIKPFKPTEQIEADSAVTFPIDI